VCKCMSVFVYMCVCINAEMPDCLASDQSGTRMKKQTLPGLVQIRTKPTQSGIYLVKYQTEIMDAGMPMSALVFSMPMPSYAYQPVNAMCSVVAVLIK
jgi:hypothetical protein